MCVPCPVTDLTRGSFVLQLSQRLPLLQQPLLSIYFLPPQACLWALPQHPGLHYTRKAKSSWLLDLEPVETLLEDPLSWPLRYRRIGCIFSSPVGARRSTGQAHGVCLTGSRA